MSTAVKLEIAPNADRFRLYGGSFEKELDYSPNTSEEDSSSQISSESEVTTESPPPTPEEIKQNIFAECTRHNKHDGIERTKKTQRRQYSTAEKPPNEFEHINFILTLKVYISWSVLVFFGFFREFLIRLGLEKEKGSSPDERTKDFVPLYNDFDAMYQRRMYIRVRDIFERPIGSCPGAMVNVLDRYSDNGNWTYKFPGTQTELINIASYNYLGFAQTEGPCADAAMKSIDQFGLSVCSSSQERGATSYLKKLEHLVAEFIGVEDAICFSMGFATNSLNVAVLADKDTLLVSDQRNHASLILGMRMAGATAKVFSHNNMNELEDILLEAVAKGNPTTKKPYSKILIVVEGIYSMEGSICPLPDIIALKKKYNAYLYLDEAHSIGATGPTGRGVVDYWCCDVNDVDIMMGTFTKSFGAAGGYIAGKKEVIDRLRTYSPTGFYSVPMSPPIAEQIYSSMTIIMGKDGTNEGARRIGQLFRNARYFRMKLKQAGMILYGSDDSPVVPMLLYMPSFVGYYSREMLKQKFGIVVVSYPACEMTEARVRFCLSAAHTKEQLDEILDHLNVLADSVGARFSKKTHLYKNLQIEW